MKFTVTVTQVLRIERTLEVEVEAVSREAAVEALENGEQDIPSEDEKWKIVRSSVENEEIS